MSVSIISKGSGRTHQYRRLIPAAMVAAMIIGIFVGCEDAYTPTSQESITISAPASREIAALSDQIKQSVKELEYSDKVAEDFAKMVSGWKDILGRSVLAYQKQRLNQAKQDYKQAKISKDQLAELEKNIVKELSQRVQKEIISGEFFDLADVIKHKQAQCLGYSQLVYIVGNSVGLSVQAIDVVELMTLGLLPPESGHVTCIVTLTDGGTMIVDLVAGGFISKPFLIEEEFATVGNYRELKDKDNPLGIHRRIQILDRNGLIAGIYDNRGNVYDALGEFTKAISCFNRAIELNATFAEAYSNRGKGYGKLGQFTQALSDLTKAVELDPKYAEAYSNRGNAYCELGQFTQAISNHTKAIELNPKLAEAYYNRGIAYGELGQFTQAISDYTKAIELNAKHAQAYNNRGAIYYKSGQLPQAISDFAKAIELNPKFAQAYYNRGIACGKLGQLPQAISDFARAIELNPKFAQAFSDRAVAYAFLGKTEKAKEDLLKAVELSPALKPSVRQISDHFKLNLKLD